jgi:Flp pilus assembly pilin Flp
MKNIIPTIPEMGREALIVIAGAIIAAAIMGQFPSVRTWIKSQWSDTQ